MSEVKQTNFRIAQEAADTFRAFCEEQGINQATGFERMLEALELQQAKVAIPTRETEISEMERCLRHIQTTYLSSLELCEQTEARVRDEYARRMESKDETILNLQGDLKKARDEAAELAAVRLQLLEAQQATAIEVSKVVAKEEELELLRKQTEKQLADKDSIIDMLTRDLALAKAKAEGYDAVKADRDDLASQLKDAQNNIRELKRDHEIALERAARDAERAQQAAVAAEKAKGDTVASQLREELQNAKIKAAEDLREAEEKAHEADKAAAADIRALEKDLAEARQKLAIFESKK